MIEPPRERKMKNKLIRDIADRFENLDSESCSYGIIPSSYEDFAEAIINECIKSIEVSVDYYGPTAVDDLKETIKKHWKLK